MRHLLGLAICLSVMPAPAGALAATLTLSGDRGFGTIEVRDADLYLADRTFNVWVEQTRQGANIGIIARTSPAGATWTGGSVVGMGVNRTATWHEIYNVLPGPGNGACFIAKNTQGMTVEHLRCDWTWDGFRPEGEGVEDWKLRLSWINNNRDDGVENDKCNNGRIEHSLIENTFVGYSARPGTETGRCTYSLQVIGNLISLGRYFEDRDKRIRPWSNIENGRVMQSGALWKVTKQGAGTSVLLRDNIIKLDHTPGVGIRELQIVRDGWEILPGSGNNTLVWLGENDLPGLTYEMIDGCKVPVEFKVPRDLFRVVCGAEGEDLWNTARIALLAKIDPSPTSDPVAEFLDGLTGQLDVQRSIDREVSKATARTRGLMGPWTT